MEFAAVFKSYGIAAVAAGHFRAAPDFTVFDELARVLGPGGRISLIDVDRPASGIVRFGHSLYFDRVIPFVGALIADRDAYRYLPQSTAYLPPAEEIFALLGKSGFEQISKHRLMLGAAQILTARLPGADA